MMKTQQRTTSHHKSTSSNQDNSSGVLSHHRSNDTSGILEDIISCLRMKTKLNSFQLTLIVFLLIFFIGFFMTLFSLPIGNLETHHDGLPQRHEFVGNSDRPPSHPIPAKTIEEGPSPPNLRINLHPPPPPILSKTLIDVPSPPVAPLVAETIVKHEIYAKSRDVNSFGLDTALLIIAANRPQYLDKTLSYVVKYHPKKSLPIIVSHDGNFEEVNAVIAKHQKTFQQTSSILFDSFSFQPTPPNKRYENGYYRLADHFKFAINKLFNDKELRYQRIILLEEDLQIASDFYEYFAALFPLLDDPSNHLLTISAWNDNGFESLVKDPKQIYRSDFFPGLGWMLTRDLWEKDLGSKWPQAYWDDWLREPKNRQGRHILRPEISRTLHFGAHGVSHAQYSEYLSTIKLNDQHVAFTKLDTSYLLEENWNKEYLSRVKEAKVATIDSFNQVIAQNRGKEVKIYYGSLDESSLEQDSYRRMSEWSGVMNNVKAGVPRTAYKGIVSFWKGDVMVHLVPKTAKL